MDDKRIARARSAEFGSHITIRIPPHERVYIIKHAGHLNWSEVCCRALMAAAKQEEEMDKLRSMRDGKA